MFRDSLAVNIVSRVLLPVSLQVCYHAAVKKLYNDVGLSRDDRFHSSLLVLNELVKISDEKYERERSVCLYMH